MYRRMDYNLRKLRELLGYLYRHGTIFNRPTNRTIGPENPECLSITHELKILYFVIFTFLPFSITSDGEICPNDRHHTRS